MKKILIIVMLLLTSNAYADNQYTMVSENSEPRGGVWIIDNKTNKLMYCWQEGNNAFPYCNQPRDLENDFKDKD
mgnify:CR=1 FL=1